MNKRKLKYLIKQLAGLYISLAVVAMLLPVSGKSQKVIPDTTSILIGGHLKITIELETEKGSLVEWPVLEDTISRSIEIISKNKADTLNSGKDKQLIRQIITITSFDTGFIVFPPLNFKLKDATGEINDLKSEPFLLEVKNVQVDTAMDIKDIKPVLNAPYTLRDFLPWILLAAAVGLMGALLWFFIRNRSRNKPFIKLPSKPQKPPHVIAIEMLEELRKDQVWQKGQIKEYYTRLTDILREFFEKRFGVNAAEMTSDEILDAMKDHLVEASLMNDLKKLLLLSDLAKFAKGQPIGSENELSMTYAKTIVLNSSVAPSINDQSNGISEEDSKNKNSVIE